jgi:hypothetical protein
MNWMKAVTGKQTSQNAFAQARQQNTIMVRLLVWPKRHYDSKAFETDDWHMHVLQGHVTAMIHSTNSSVARNQKIIKCCRCYIQILYSILKLFLWLVKQSDILTCANTSDYRECGTKKKLHDEHCIINLYCSVKFHY